MVSWLKRMMESEWIKIAELVPIIYGVISTLHKVYNGYERNHIRKSRYKVLNVLIDCKQEIFTHAGLLIIDLIILKYITGRLDFDDNTYI